MNIENGTRVEPSPTGAAPASNATMNGSACADCEDHTTVNIPSEVEAEAEAGAPPQTEHDHNNDMVNRGSSAWRRALLTLFECQDTEEGLRQLFGPE